MKRKLLEYIQTLTPEQADKVMAHLPHLERCLNDAQATRTDTITVNRLEE